jgi:hypothetical protein
VIRLQQKIGASKILGFSTQYAGKQKLRLLGREGLLTTLNGFNL